MKQLPSKILLIFALVIAALSVSACGKENPDERTFAPTLAVALDIGGLTYQVQISRLLNPSDGEDGGYLVDLPSNEQQVKPSEVWYGVFIKAFNDTGKPLQSAKQFEVVDTEGNVYRPVSLGPKNVFAYHAQRVGKDGGQIPSPNTPADSAPTQGALLLFKVTYESLDNRPLELRVHDPYNPKRVSSFELDV